MERLDPVGDRRGRLHPYSHRIHTGVDGSALGHQGLHGGGTGQPVGHLQPQQFGTAKPLALGGQIGLGRGAGERPIAARAWPSSTGEAISPRPSRTSPAPVTPLLRVRRRRGRVARGSLRPGQDGGTGRSRGDSYLDNLLRDRPAPTGPAGPRTRARPGRGRTRLAPRGRTTQRDLRPDLRTPRGTR